MSSLFKNLKSIFVIDGKDQKASAQPTPPPENDESGLPKAQKSDATMEQTMDGSDEGGSVNEKFTEILLRAIESNNQEGFDYIEYKRSLENLSQMDLDESTSYKSAFAAAQTMGATPSSLIESASGYLAVLKKEEGKFQAALEKQRGKQIDGGIQQIKQLELSIDEKQQKISALTEEINATRIELDKLKKDVEQAGEKVKQTKNDFVASYSNLVTQIQSDIDKIKEYLG